MGGPLAGGEFMKQEGKEMDDEAPGKRALAARVSPRRGGGCGPDGTGRASPAVDR